MAMFDHAKIVEMLKAGKVGREIADEIGCSICTVTMVRKKYDLKKYAPRLAHSKRPERAELAANFHLGIKALAKKYDVSKASVYKWVQECGLAEINRRPRMDMTRVRQLADEGKSGTEIAAQLGYSAGHFRRVCRREGIVLSTHKKRPEKSDLAEMCHLTRKQLAKHYDAHTDSIYAWLQMYELECARSMVRRSVAAPCPRHFAFSASPRAIERAMGQVAR